MNSKQQTANSRKWVGRKVRLFAPCGLLFAVYCLLLLLTRHQPLHYFNQRLRINADKNYANQRNYQGGLQSG